MSAGLSTPLGLIPRLVCSYCSRGGGLLRPSFTLVTAAVCKEQV